MYDHPNFPVSPPLQCLSTYIVLAEREKLDSDSNARKSPFELAKWT